MDKGIKPNETLVYEVSFLHKKERCNIFTIVDQVD